MFDINALMKQAQEMQGKMKQMQEDLARKQITADAGGGMVQATVNGKHGTREAENRQEQSRP